MSTPINTDSIASITHWLGSGSINLFGSPFAGKDTQGQRIADMLSAPLIGGGDILRSSNTHHRVKKIIDTGKLAPTKHFLDIVVPYLQQKEFDGKPLILSSIGRWHGEEEGIMQAVADADHPLRAVVFLHLGEQEVRTRWAAAQAQDDRGQRADDAAEALEIRLEEFRTKTLPVIEFYRDKGLLIEVEGNASRDEVTDNILAALAKRAQV